MRHPTSKLLTATLPLVVAFVTGCNQGPGTSVQVTLGYDDALGLDTAEVTLADRTQSAPIAHELLLLVPDELAGADMTMAVWGRKAGKRTAYGTSTAVPKLGKTVTASLTLDACTPACNGNQLSTCTGPMVTCTLSCSSDGDAHCIVLKPANGVDPTLADPLNGTTTISAPTTIDTDTGAITGGLVRASGTGITGGVGYYQAPAFGAGGAPLGIFVFHNLTIEATATVRFTGARAAVLLVGDIAKISGAIDVAAGLTARSVPGPGGGAGGTQSALAQGCGAGGPGTKAGLIDSGGGGGGGSQMGGPGGDVSTTLGGAAGKACLPALLEPLQGGSGGGRGSPGTTATTPSGGGGGGALQITALGSLEITGTINAGGAGGEGGPASASDSGAGAGGGSGGAILLESLVVMVGNPAVLAANGGGGGGGGGTGTQGQSGQNALASTATPDGGFGGESGSSGGTGGALGPPDVGGTGTTNGGGGGGGVGAITIRGRTRVITGALFSPPPAQFDIQLSP